MVCVCEIVGLLQKTVFYMRVFVVISLRLCFHVDMFTSISLGPYFSVSTCSMFIMKIASLKENYCTVDSI